MNHYSNMKATSATCFMSLIVPGTSWMPSAQIARMASSLLPPNLWNRRDFGKGLLGNAATVAFSLPKFNQRYESTSSAGASTGTTKPKRIAIVGGGIAGVSVAHALSQKIDTSLHKIVVYEGDTNNPVSHQQQESFAPQWTAATARNANSLVPAASMHVFSCPSSVMQVLGDTAREIYLEQKELLKPQDKRSTLRKDNFEFAPPYFALHLSRCIGPSASHDERMSFFRFIRHFLTIAFLGNPEERGRVLVQLAQANRARYLKEIEGDKEIQKEIGHSQGFLSIHRSIEKAQAAVEEAHEYGEEAEVLDWNKAIEVEPHLARLPMSPLYAVYRKNDYTASCERFVARWIQDSTKSGVEYRQGQVTKVHQSKNEKPTFRVHVQGENEGDDEYDYVILAAGPNTPLLASKLGAGDYCPTYPLRGYSMTLFTWQQDPKKPKERNLLHKPFSLDSMYCSSISPFMARMAGFGEFVGYRDKARDVGSHAPAILARYGAVLFPDAKNAVPETPIQCFRCISADDIPLVGEVRKVPGLFLHTGHGTLGWTMGLATGECLAQEVSDKMEEKTSEYFELPDGSRLERKLLSPNRFQ